MVEFLSPTTNFFFYIFTQGHLHFHELRCLPGIDSFWAGPSETVFLTSGIATGVRHVRIQQMGGSFLTVIHLPTSGKLHFREFWIWHGTFFLKKMVQNIPLGVGNRIFEKRKDLNHDVTEKNSSSMKSFRPQAVLLGYFFRVNPWVKIFSKYLH